jgi:uncharacterized protein YjbI with pentapeptide repeats/nucleoside phosphorylase
MSSSRRGWHLIDFAVIATLEEEFDAVKRVFGLQDEDFRKEENFYYKEIHEIRVGFFKFTQRGNLQSASQTQEIIERFKPEYIILVGIAGGFRGNIRLGDVAVSEYLEYYEYKKVDNGGLKPRPITIAAPSKQLLDIVPRVGDRWKECVKTPRPDGKRVEETRVVPGFILSGETIQSGKLLIDEGILKKKPIAVETEAGGVGKAVWTTGESQYLVVKGISDFADAPESQELREKWRSYASEVAAAFAYGLILTAIETIYAGISEVREDLKNYLKKIKNEFEEPNPIDHKRLKEYYVQSSLILTSGETWSMPDELVGRIGTEWRVDDFLRDATKWMIVIGAPFGTGKTSFVKYLAFKYAEQCLSQNREAPFPILVKLREMTDISSGFVYEQETLESILRKIWIENESRKVLLILDGLDEYGGELRSFFQYLTKLHNEFGEKVKVIVTSRLVYIPKEYIREYVRLMPFTDEQVNEFFRRYGVDLTYEKCVKLGLGREEVSKPLFCWILGITSSDESYKMELERASLGTAREFLLANQSYKLEFKPAWPSTVRKSLLYYIFIHNLLKGKHKKEKEVEKFRKYYHDEKKLLRYIAALKNMHGELDEKTLKVSLTEIYEVDRNRIESYFEPLITSYFHRSTNGIGSQKIEFIHKSFQEYLLAEYYYECIKEGKAHWLNVGIPSEETMSFLKGLVQMLEYYSVQEVLKSIDGENAFIKTEDREKVFKNSKNITEDESYILPTTNTEIVEHKFWTKINISADHHPLMWMHRWIALSVLSWLYVGETIDVHKIERLIRLSSYYPIPSHVKNLERMNLSGADLAGANLRRANLVEANLTGANLVGVALSGADLAGANLRRANLTRANLVKANLTGANLVEANLTGANLSGAILIEADLAGSLLTRANLTEANLEKAGLIGANLNRAVLKRANMRGADLTDAILRNADLSDADFTGATLCNADLRGAKTVRAIFRDADLSGVIGLKTTD